MLLRVKKVRGCCFQEMGRMFQTCDGKFKCKLAGDVIKTCIVLVMQAGVFQSLDQGRNHDSSGRT